MWLGYCQLDPESESSTKDGNGGAVRETKVVDGFIKFRTVTKLLGCSSSSTI